MLIGDLESYAFFLGAATPAALCSARMRRLVTCDLEPRLELAGLVYGHKTDGGDVVLQDGVCLDGSFPVRFHQSGDKPGRRAAWCFQKHAQWKWRAIGDASASVGWVAET